MGVKPAASMWHSLDWVGLPEGTHLMLLLVGPGAAPEPGPGLVLRPLWGLASRHQHQGMGRGWGEGSWCCSSGLRCSRVGAVMSTYGEVTLCSSFFFLVCILIENLSLSKMPFRGDAVIGKCLSSPVIHIVAFSSRTTSA